MHFSRLYMQKFNAVVERPIRTVVEVVAVSRHANTPHKFMHLATLRSENAESIHRKLHGGTVDVPLWRFNGSRISLNLDRYHPFRCAVEAPGALRQRRGVFGCFFNQPPVWLSPEGPPRQYHLWHRIVIILLAEHLEMEAGLGCGP